MMKLTEENWKENLEKVTKLEKVIVQAYRPDVGFLSGRPDYQPYWAGRADGIIPLDTGDALSMMIYPCVNANLEVPEHLLRSIVEGYEKTGSDKNERSVTKFHPGFGSFLDSSYVGYKINMADMSNVVFPDAPGQGGYLIIYDE